MDKKKYIYIGRTLCPFGKTIQVISYSFLVTTYNEDEEKEYYDFHFKTQKEAKAVRHLWEKDGFSIVSPVRKEEHKIFTRNCNSDVRRKHLKEYYKDWKVILPVK